MVLKNIIDLFSHASVASKTTLMACEKSRTSISLVSCAFEKPKRPGNYSVEKQSREKGFDGGRW